MFPRDLGRGTQERVGRKGEQKGTREGKESKRKRQEWKECLEHLDVAA